jgi:hypothetical protein
MPDVQPQPEEETNDIIVTGARFRGDATVKPSGWWVNFATVQPPSFLNLFEERGGEETSRIATFDNIDGDLIVKLPGYSFTLRVPAAEWASMGERARGEFIKVMIEFRDSPMLTAAFDTAEAGGLLRITVRYADMVHSPTAAPEAWGPNQAGEAKVEYAKNADLTEDLTRIDGVTININPAIVRGDGNLFTWPNTQGENVLVTMALVLAHEIRHIFYPGRDPSEEGPVLRDADQIMDDLFNTPNSAERSLEDYLGGQTFQGSLYGDNAVGTSAGDTLAGLSGNDILNGAAGDDLVMGGAGMDRLSGGSGSNIVMGGLDADTYAPAPGVAHEFISDTGGVDRIDLSSVALGQATFLRTDDTLVISVAGTAPMTIEVQDQWGASGKVEQFTFSDGTYAASYIEDLASGGAFVCQLCDPMTVTACEHYAMPVVLDLDGDGIELIPVEDSRARFDIAGDGRWEHIGWVGADDGILSLDRNGNGRIDDFSEISFVGDFLGAATDLEGLYAYDTDRDGFLTAADARFADFLVWKDGNGNGHSERGELFTLDALGIVSIGLERRDVRQLDSGAEANQVLATSSFQTSDGRTLLVGDVALEARLHNQGNAGSSVDLLHLNAEAIII